MAGPSDIPIPIPDPDPARDIDGTKTLLVLAGLVVGGLILIWIMTHVFTNLVMVERQKKIGDLAPEELMQIRTIEDQELKGENPNRGSMSIEKAMEDLVRK